MSALQTLEHLGRDVVGRAHEAVRDAARVLALLAALQQLLAVVGGAGAPPAVQVQVPGVHAVLPTVACRIK